MSFLGRVTQNLQSIINYVSNGSADNSVTGWVAYADAAGTQPVDGTGGSPTLILARSTLTPLRQGADFNLIKDAANRQGQGISYDFTVDRADLAKVLTVTFDYEVLSGTYATGDLAVYLIQDPTGTPVVIQPAGYRVQSVTVGTTTKQIATFQTSSSIRNYRLCLHVASTSASAYSIAFDKVSIGPQVVQYGAPVTDWQAYTPTFTGMGTVVAIDIQWRRVGDLIQLRGKFQTGTVTAVEARMTLPPGLTAAGTDKIPTIQVAGTMNWATSTSVGVVLQEPNVAYVTFGFQNSTSNPLNKINGTTLTNNLVYSVIASMPIAGYSSSVQMSNDTDTRVISTGVRASATVSMTANNPIIFQAIDFDRSGSYNATTGQFTVPVAGVYEMSVVGFLTVAGTSNIRPYKNGSPTQGGFIVAFNGGAPVSGSYLVDCKAGDILTFVSDATTTLSTNSVGFFKRLSGPSAIAASETVAARYTVAAAVSSSTTQPINYATKVFDTHGAVTTGAAWKFTAPISGRYQVSTSGASSIIINADVYKNGVFYSTTASWDSPTVRSGTLLIEMNAGDYFDVRASALATTNASGANVHISIHRIGI